jgi:hypothetical protein
MAFICNGPTATQPTSILVTKSIARRPGNVGTFTLLTQTAAASYHDPVIPGSTFSYEVREIEPGDVSPFSNVASASAAPGIYLIKPAGLQASNPTHYASKNPSRKSGYASLRLFPLGLSHPQFRRFGF